MQILANEYTTVFSSPDPENLYCYSPGITTLPNGRLIATMDLGGPGVDDLSEPKGIRYGKAVKGKVFTSDDRGGSWMHRVDFPFMMARPFCFEGRVYVMGLAGDLKIIASEDNGASWSQPAALTHGQQWTQAPSNVLYANDCVYLVMNQRPASDVDGWPVSVEQPVLMRGNPGCDLTRPESWTFARSRMFREFIDSDALDYFGVPFFPSFPETSFKAAPGRMSAPIGWLETNVVTITDPNHYWYDPAGRTFYLWSRAHTGGTGYAAIAKVHEEGPKPGSGAMHTTLAQAPSGRTMAYVPCPGGQMKFHVLYDDQTQLYWLLSTQATDSMTRAEKLPPDRFNLPNNERRRLQLHFSRNMIDWCFAGLVAVGDSELASRHYASMTILDDDLLVLSRSGDGRSNPNPHDTNLITLHRIRRFRDLVY